MTFGAASTFTWIPKLGCASIAAVQGHAYGAGLQLATQDIVEFLRSEVGEAIVKQCDIRVLFGQTPEPTVPSEPTGAAESEPPSAAEPESDEMARRARNQQAARREVWGV